MASKQDPVERAAVSSPDGDEVDLQEVARWEPRSSLDRIAVRGYRWAVLGSRWLLVIVGLAILATLFALTGLSTVVDPLVGTLVVLSVLPALALAAYVWRTDITTGEPMSVLLITFLLSVLLAGFAAVINTVATGLFPFSVAAGTLTVGTIVFFYAVVGPVEEAVKLLAVRLYAFEHPRFDAVIDGAVYGAVAGLGFATIENAVYITGVLQTASGDVATAGGITAARALAGPGHVLYSSIAGYFLGLAKFNPRYAGPLVVKGLLVAAVFHATYNVLVGVAPETIATLAPVGTFEGLVGFVVGYAGLVGYYLYRKIKRYREAYRTLDAGRTQSPPQPEPAEFDPDGP